MAEFTRGDRASDINPLSLYLLQRNKTPVTTTSPQAVNPLSSLTPTEALPFPVYGWR